MSVSSLRKSNPHGSLRIGDSHDILRIEVLVRAIEDGERSQK